MTWHCILGASQAQGWMLSMSGGNLATILCQTGYQACWNGAAQIWTCLTEKEALVMPSEAPQRHCELKHTTLGRKVLLFSCGPMIMAVMFVSSPPTYFFWSLASVPNPLACIWTFQSNLQLTRVVGPSLILSSSLAWTLLICLPSIFGYPFTDTLGLFLFTDRLMDRYWERKYTLQQNVWLYLYNSYLRTKVCT